MVNLTTNCKSHTSGGRRPCLPISHREATGRAGTPAPTNQFFHSFSRPPRSIPANGYTLAGALVLIAIMSIFMAISLPLWTRVKQRENEEELIFRGKEYAEAIARYHAKFNSYPPDMETLEKLKFVRKLYKDPMTASGKWKVLHPDSLVETGAAGFINQPGGAKQEEDQKGEDKNRPGGVLPGLSDNRKKTESDKETKEGKDSEEEESVGPVVGVVSRSSKTSIRVYNGQSTYNKWVFAFVPQQPQGQQPGPGTKPGKGGKPANQPGPGKTPGTKPNSSPGTQNQDQDQNQIDE